ncbi:MAG TPA: sulfotransferase domain-containing protein [Candidatus Acidoferrales bacterium]|nr:sulfotransferase domain-containing protein [Candidatus Acidoferrales bacterium]
MDRGVRVRRRNLSSAARRYLEADAIVVSIPKSGRTWLRVFLQAYFCALEGIPFIFDKYKLPNGKIQRLVYTHDLWRHLASAGFADRLRGKHLIPRKAVETKPIILMARDPRDVMVSLYFQWTRRAHAYRGAISEMIRDRRLGIWPVVNIMNTWMVEWGSRRDFKLVRYEDCREDTEKEFRDVLLFLGVDKVDVAAMRQAIEFCSFENMRAMEAAGRFETKILKPGDVNDPESFKVRRGIVGGYRRYLEPGDVEYLKQAISALDPRFGYRVEERRSSQPATS